MAIDGVNGYNNFITVNHRSLMRQSAGSTRNSGMSPVVFNSNSNRHASGTGGANIDYSSLTAQYANYLGNSSTSSSTSSSDSGLDLNWSGAVSEGLSGAWEGFAKNGLKDGLKSGDWKGAAISGAMGFVSGLFKSKSST